MVNQLAIFILLITFTSFVQSITREQIVQLIQETPDLSYLTSDSPLFSAIKYKELSEIVALILEHKANPNVQDNSLLGDTPLHKTAWNNNAQAALLLLQAGANSNSKNRNSADTPVHLAVSYNSYDVLQLLLRFGVHLNEKNRYGHTPLHEALQKDILHKGLQKNRTKIVKLLLYYGADPLVQNNNEENALSIAYKEYTRVLHAAQAYQTCELHAETQSYKEITRLLITHVGLYTQQSRIAHEGLAQILPLEIAYRIASYLPEYTIHPKQEYQVCPICFEQDTEPRATLACGHNCFHVTCLEQWKEMLASTAHQCPLCRKQLS